MTEQTPDEIRLRIAKAKGWKFPGYVDHEWQDGNGLTPPWPYDIRAAYDLESELTTPEERYEYCRAINQIVNKADEGSGYENITSDFRWWFLHATPLQRCEAWLIVKEPNNG